MLRFPPTDIAAIYYDAIGKKRFAAPPSEQPERNFCRILNTNTKVEVCLWKGNVQDVFEGQSCRCKFGISKSGSQSREKLSAVINRRGLRRGVDERCLLGTNGGRNLKNWSVLCEGMQLTHDPLTRVWCIWWWVLCKIRLGPWWLSCWVIKLRQNRKSTCLVVF